MTRWRPIETAPKDGTEVLVFVPPNRLSVNPFVAQARNPTGAQWWARRVGSIKPTHWMPLPDPPEEER